MAAGSDGPGVMRRPRVVEIAAVSLSVLLSLLRQFESFLSYQPEGPAAARGRGLSGRPDRRPGPGDRPG
eukprot:255985-Hanusia_phi.AAC.3